MSPRPFVLDCETALIRPGCQAPPLACVAFWDGSGGSVFGRRDPWPDVVARVLTDPQILIVGHTVAFDLAVLANECNDLLPLIFDAYEQDRVTDTEVRQKLLDIAAGVYREFTDEDAETGKVAKVTYDLEALSWRLLRRRLDKDTWRLRYGELVDVPIHLWPEGARLYPLEDVRATGDIFQVQEIPTVQTYLVDQYRQARAAFWLRLMANWGLRTDPQGIWELADRTKREYDQIAGDLRSLGLLRPDRQVRRRATGLVETEPGSRNVAAARDRMVDAYGALGKPIPMTDPSQAHPRGQVSLDEQACIDSGDPVLVQYARLTSLRTVLSKDVPMLEAGVTVPIHSRFESLAETGRTTSSNPNVQNPRRLPGVRECFVPACLICGLIHTTKVARLGACPRCGGEIVVFISADFGGLELFTLSEVCWAILGYSTLGQALNAGQDPHLLIAEDMLGWPYDVLKGLKKAGPGPDCTSKIQVCHCPYCVMSDSRQVGKVLNFGCGAGLGSEGLVFFAMTGYGVRLTEARAAELIKIWKRRWIEMADYFRWVNSQTAASFPLIKHLYSDRYRGAVRYTEACNSFFQGLGADIAKAAGWDIARACYVDRQSPLFGTRIVNFIHDEFLGVCCQSKAHDAATEMSRLMVQASKPWLPHLRDIDAEPMVIRRWSKNAKAVRENGRLVPWEP